MKKEKSILELICYKIKINIYKYPYIYIILSVILLVALTISITFIINEAYKMNKGYYTLWEAKDVLSFYGSFLSFIGTVTLGVLAILMSKNANKISKNAFELSENFIEIERKDRKTFISIDIEKKLNIFFVNKDFFLNKLNERNLTFEADFVVNTHQTNDIILFEFYLKNISSNYATGVHLNKFGIYPEFESEGVAALECHGGTSYIIEPYQSQKVFVIITGLKLYLQKEPIEYIGDICNFKLEISIINLYEEKTNISIDLHAEIVDFNNKIGKKSFELSLYELKVLK